MSLLFIDGFDHLSNSTASMKYSALTGSSAQLSVVTGRRASSSAFRFYANLVSLSKTIPETSTVFAGFAFNVSALFANRIISFIDSSGSAQTTLALSATGYLEARRGSVSGTLLGTSSSPITAGEWNFIEVKVFINDSTGIFEIKVNGIVVLSYSGDTKQSSTISTISSFIIGGTSSSGIYNSYDDLYICDANGSVNNNYLGDCRVDTLVPTEVGNYSQFTPTGSATNWENVDEIPPDSDTSYNSSDTAGHKDSFGFSSLSGTGATIFGVQTNLIARKDDAGTRTLKSLVRSGGTDANGATHTLGDAYVDQTALFETNPVGSATWTESAINAAEFGYEVAS